MPISLTSLTLSEVQVMGVFFKTILTAAPSEFELVATLRRHGAQFVCEPKTQPEKTKDIEGQAPAPAAQAQGQSQRSQFLWWRFATAVSMLALLGGFGVWSATIPSLDAWSKMFLHSFEILFGAVAGLLGAESTTH